MKLYHGSNVEFCQIDKRLSTPSELHINGHSAPKEPYNSLNTLVNASNRKRFQIYG